MKAHTVIRLTLACLLSLQVVACARDVRPDEKAPRSLDETSAEALFKRGKELARAGEHVAAEQFLLAAQKRGYVEAEVIKELVRVCVAASRLDSALGHALPYLERNPDDFLLRQVVATVHLAAGDAPAARVELEEVIATRPEQAEAHYLMGVLLRDEYGDPEGARVFFENYLHLVPSGPHAAELRGFLRRQARVVASSSLLEVAP